MGNKCQCFEALEDSEHARENICCNDNFFSLFGLFSLSQFDYSFSLKYRQRYQFNPPSASFIEQEQKSPPRLLVEVRKGIRFPKEESQYSVKVVFHPSCQASSSLPTTSPNPRWYFLAMRMYSDPSVEMDHTVVIEIEKENEVVGRVVIDLEQYVDMYTVFWTPVRMLTMREEPLMEIRVWDLVHPKIFWDPEGEPFKKAVASILSTTQTS